MKVLKSHFAKNKSANKYELMHSRPGCVQMQLEPLIRETLYLLKAKTDEPTPPTTTGKQQAPDCERSSFASDTWWK